MNLAPPIPRLGLPGRERELTPEEQRKTANRQPARTRTTGRSSSASATRPTT